MLVATISVLVLWSIDSTTARAVALWNGVRPSSRPLSQLPDVTVTYDTADAAAVFVALSSHGAADPASSLATEPPTRESATKSRRRLSTAADAKSVHSRPHVAGTPSGAVSYRQRRRPRPCVHHAPGRCTCMACKVLRRRAASENLRGKHIFGHLEGNKSYYPYPKPREFVFTCCKPR